MNRGASHHRNATHTPQPLPASADRHCSFEEWSAWYAVFSQPTGLEEPEQALEGKATALGPSLLGALCGSPSLTTYKTDSPGSHLKTRHRRLMWRELVQPLWQAAWVAGLEPHLCSTRHCFWKLALSSRWSSQGTGAKRWPVGPHLFMSLPYTRLLSLLSTQG